MANDETTTGGCQCGAVRYRCPHNDSLVLVTDEAALAELDRPAARLRCAACGEMHLLIQSDK